MTREELGRLIGYAALGYGTEREAKLARLLKAALAVVDCASSDTSSAYMESALRQFSAALASESA